MRVSDWSSDVCSSDLTRSSYSSRNTVMRCGYRTILMLGALVLGAPAALAQTGLPADTELRRQRFLTKILDPNEEFTRPVARDRQDLSGDIAPQNERDTRAGGVSFLPNIPDTLVDNPHRQAPP